jgi:hypothetical protein
MNATFRRVAFSLALLLSFPTAFGQSGSVANATFTSSIAGGAPVDYRQEFLASSTAVYYYGELLGLAGQTVTHRWSREGKVMQEVPVKVTANRQPAWSKMDMQPQWTGNWTVTVVNAKGEVLDRRNFAYNPQ